MKVWYVDTSAVVKLIRIEGESAALIRWLSSRTWVISDLHRTELRRVARRVGPVTAARADRLLGEVDVLVLTGATFDRAGRLDPDGLRSLDAIHLASALALVDDLAGIVAYDQRLLGAAAGAGISTSSPS